MIWVALGFFMLGGFFGVMAMAMLIAGSDSDHKDDEDFFKR